MTDQQEHAIWHPLARANRSQQAAQAFRRLDRDWSIILTVNK